MVRWADVRKLGREGSKPIVELWESVGFGVIISYPTGVLYSNQTGGTSCLHPTIEGIYVPLSNDIAVPEGKLLSPDTELFAYFTGPKHRGAGATRGLDLDDAAFIEATLAKWRLSSFVTIDRTRLRDSHEAWVWSTVVADGGDEDLAIFAGFSPYPRPGVLTWTNSD